MRNAYFQLISYINTTEKHDVYYYSARTILKEMKHIVDYSIVEVADMCYASTATISRLIRRLNYPSFNDFKQDVIYTLSEMEDQIPMHYNSEPVNLYPKVDFNQLKEEFVENVISNIQYTNHLLTTADLMDIVDKISKAKRVFLIGFNFCQVLSSQLQSELALNDVDCFAPINEAHQLSLLKDAKADDLIIVASITGNYFKNKHEAMQIIKKLTCTKLAFTQNPELALKSGIDKVFVIGEKGPSYIGKFSMMLLFEMIEMFFHATHQD